MEKKGLSWGWIIFWLIVFWPVGLYFVIKKMSSDKSAIMSGKTNSLSIIAWVLIGFGGLSAIAGITNPEEGSTGVIAFAIGMVLGGVLLLLKSNKAKKLAIKYKKYIDVIVNQNNRSIDYIASAVGVQYSDAINDLQEMINIGYLNGAFIQQGTREIVFKQLDTVIPSPFVGQTAPKTTVVRCPGCGANNVIPINSVTSCEYCGTAIQG